MSGDKRGPGRPRVTGRKPSEGNPQLLLRLNHELHEATQSRGGASWVRELIARELRPLDASAAANEMDSVSRLAILNAGQGAILAAHGYLASLALGYECAAPTSADAEKFLRLLRD